MLNKYHVWLCVESTWEFPYNMLAAAAGPMLVVLPEDGVVLAAFLEPFRTTFVVPLVGWPLLEVKVTGSTGPSLVH